MLIILEIGFVEQVREKCDNISVPNVTFPLQHNHGKVLAVFDGGIRLID